jgi:hypothetical protein
MRCPPCGCLLLLTNCNPHVTVLRKILYRGYCRTNETLHEREPHPQPKDPGQHKRALEYLGTVNVSRSNIDTPNTSTSSKASHNTYRANGNRRNHRNNVNYNNINNNNNAYNIGHTKGRYNTDINSERLSTMVTDTTKLNYEAPLANRGINKSLEVHTFNNNAGVNTDSNSSGKSLHLDYVEKAIHRLHTRLLTNEPPPSSST